MIRPTCKAPRNRKQGWLASLFGPRCEKPAVYKTALGVTVCADCGERMKQDHEDGKTILSRGIAGSTFPLYPIH